MNLRFGRKVRQWIALCYLGCLGAAISWGAGCDQTRHGAACDTEMQCPSGASCMNGTCVDDQCKRVAADDCGLCGAGNCCDRLLRCTGSRGCTTFARCHAKCSPSDTQ